MVAHRYNLSRPNWVFIRLRALVCVVLSVLLSACNVSDDNLATTDSSSGPDSPLTEDAADDPGNRADAVIIPASAQPVAIELSTVEETPVSGFFATIGLSVSSSANASLQEPPYYIVSQPLHGTIVQEGNSRLFTYVPDRDFFGTDTFEYSIAEGKNAPVSIIVSNVNDAPVLFTDLLRVVEAGSEYKTSLVASDPDNDALIYTASNLPSWLSLNQNTGELSGTPTRFDIGVFQNLTFSVTDVRGLSQTVSDVVIEVIAANDAPFINVDQIPSDLDAGEMIVVPLFPDDSNGDPVAVTYEPNELLDINVSLGVIEIVAAEVEEVTKVEMVLRATDIRGGVTVTTVPFILHPMNASGRGRTLYGRGAGGAGVHLVVLGDGYREDQQAVFREHVETLVEKMRADVGMSTHFSAWNIHMVETPSVDSGIDDNLSVDIRDTVFGTGYFCKSVRRLICGDQSAMFSVAIDEYPNFDQILVLVNDSRYGGGGGNIAISSTESIEIALHEMGHTIAGLADEYVDQYIPESSMPSFVEGQYPNVSSRSEPSDVPWSHFFAPEDGFSAFSPDLEVGVYEGAFYRANGFYRPTPDSLMRSYDGTLGPINSEQWALAVYSRATPILDIAPVTRLLTLPAGAAQEFRVEPMFGSDLQSVEWRLDSRVIPDSGLDRSSVNLSFPAGEYKVSVSVKDISGLIRKPEPHNGVFNWEWTVVSQ